MVYFKLIKREEYDMGKVLNKEHIIGRKYNMLTIVDLIFYYDNKRKKKWNAVCQCECGNSKTIRFDVIKNNKVKSCGCIKKELDKNRHLQLINKNTSMIKLNNFTNAKFHVGEKYNKLTIINTKLHENKKMYIYECKCDCGNITNQIYADLKNGKVKSCGCLQKEIASICGSTTGLNNFKSKYNWYFI
jgi:hypothetical protein